MMERYIVRTIRRCDEKTCSEFARLGTATTYEAQDRTELFNNNTRPIQQGVTVCGPTVAAICPAGDNLMLHTAIEYCQPSDILVVTTEGESNKYGMLGEQLITKSLMKRGVKGVVMDGGVRDTTQLRELNFPVWTTAIVCTGTTKNRAGQANAPAICAGVLAEAGDLIVTDDDGVIVVKREDIPQTLEKSLLREKKEQETTRKIEGDQLSVDFYGFRDVIARLGVRYYDTLEQVIESARP